MKILRFVSGVVFSLSGVAVQASAPGTLDPSFGGGDGVVLTGFNPVDASAQAVLQQPDGKLVVAGWVSATNPSTDEKRMMVARYHSSNGTLDTTFSGDGVMQISYDDGIRAQALARQSDGKLLVAGWTRHVGSNDKLAVVRINANGTLDALFGSNGISTADAGPTNARAFAVAARSDGSIWVAGYSSQAGTNGDDFMLVRFKSNGALDTGFGSGGGILTDIGRGTDRAYALLKQADGKTVLMGESAVLVNNVPVGRHFGVLRFNSDGSLDKSFSGDGKQTTAFRSSDDAVARTGIQQKDGRLVVVGSSAATSGGDRDIAIVRYLSTGALDSNFGNNGKVLTDIDGDDDVATGVIQQYDGKLLVAANSSDGSSVLVRYNQNGSLDNTFGVGGKLVTALAGSLVLNGMVEQADGQVVAVGASFASGNYVLAVLRYLFDDDDGDGVIDTADNCQYVPNADQLNFDADAQGDACDDDDDNDGVLDSEDAFPLDPTESVDTDGDGIGNNADPDDDNDGVLDGDDPFPLDPFLLNRIVGGKGDMAGYSVAMVGDVNGDGFAEILVGAPKADVVLPAQTKKSADVGAAYLVDGKELVVLQTFSGEAKGDEFGTVVVALGDINGDTVPDFAVGAPKADELDTVTKKILKKDSGSVKVYSGANNTVLLALKGAAAGDGFGVALTATNSNILIGAWKADVIDPVTTKTLKDAGAAYLYDTAGVLLNSFTGTAAGDYFGYVVTSGADLNHDGATEWAIGAYRHDPLDSLTNKMKKDAGSVYVYQSAPPYTLVNQLNGDKAGDNFGFALAAVNEGQDAFRDLLVGAPKADVVVGSKKLADAGKVALFADNTGVALYTQSTGTPQAGERFGSAVAAVGDVDASGTEAFAVGSPKTDGVTTEGKKLKDAGLVTVRSAASAGAIVFRVTGDIAKGQTGFSVAGGSDYNNDGYKDVLIGSPYAMFNQLAKAGIAEVISGKEASEAIP